MQIGRAADDDIAGDQVRIIKAHLHGPHPAHRVADQNGAVDAQSGQNRGIVGRHVLNGIARERLGGEPVSARLNHNAVVLMGQDRSLIGPQPGVGRKAVQKDQGKPLSIVVIVNPHSLFPFDVRHRLPPHIPKCILQHIPQTYTCPASDFFAAYNTPNRQAHRAPIGTANKESPKAVVWSPS